MNSIIYFLNRKFEHNKLSPTVNIWTTVIWLRKKIVGQKDALKFILIKEKTFWFITKLELEFILILYPVSNTNPTTLNLAN